ncbi:MAG: LCP family protein [Acidimicrobiia bacterium]
MARRSRHRRLKRTRGFRFFDGRGRRRQTRDPEAGPPSPDELARVADRAAGARARRRVVGSLVAAAVIVAGAVAVTLIVLRPDEPVPEIPAPAEEGASLLALVIDGSGRATSTALLAVRPGRPSYLVLFPPALLVTVPGYGDALISQATEFAGPQLASLTVSNLLGVRIDDTLVFPPGSLVEAVQQPLMVELEVPLLVREEDGERVVAGTGSGSRDPALLETLLTVQGTGDQLQWLQRQGAVWKSVVEEAGQNPELAERLGSHAGGAPAPAVEVLVALGRDLELLVTAVPVSRIAVGGETERYQLSGDEAAGFVEGRFQYLRLRPEPRPRVEVLNGNGRVGTTQAVAEALVRRGFRVLKTDNADRFDYAETQVIAQGRENQEEALEAREVLGRGEVILELRRPSGVVDLTIIVGQDIPSEEG